MGEVREKRKTQYLLKPEPTICYLDITPFYDLLKLII